MEAMACGLPIVASENRGHRELVKDQINGFVIPSENFSNFLCDYWNYLQSNDMRREMGIESVNHLKTYSLSHVSSELSKIYSHYMVGDIHGAKSKHNRAYI